MIGYIYITTNTINNKKYIGKHESTFFDEKYLGSGIYLCNAIKKYGIENFKCELLVTADTIDELNSKEKFWIKIFKATESDMYYNIADGGNGGNLISGFTDVQKQERNRKISLAMTGKNNPMYGVSWKDYSTQEKIDNHKKKISEAVKKRYLDEENRKKTSLASKKMWQNEEFRKAQCEKRRGAGNSMYGKKQTEKMKNSRRRKVRIHIKDEIYDFNSFTSASQFIKDKYGMTQNTFARWFKEPYKTHYGKYYDLIGSYAEYI